MDRLTTQTKCRGVIQSYSIEALHPDVKQCIEKAEMLVADPYLDEIFKK